MISNPLLADLGKDWEGDLRMWYEVVTLIMDKKILNQNSPSSFC